MEHTILTNLIIPLAITIIGGAFTFYISTQRNNINNENENRNNRNSIKILEEAMSEFKKNYELEKNDIHKDINAKNEKILVLRSELDNQKDKLDSHTKEYANEIKDISKSLNNFAISISNLDITLQSLKEIIKNIQQK